MAKGDITTVRLSGAAVDDEGAVLMFNDDELAIGMTEDEGRRVLLALAETLGQVQEERIGAGGGEYAMHATRLGVSRSANGHEVILRFWLVGDLRMNIAVPKAMLTDLMEGFAEIQRLQSASPTQPN